MRYLITNILTIVLLFTANLLWAKDIPKPQDKLVYDVAEFLSESEEQHLETKLRAYHDSTSTQIVVYLDNSLEGEALELFTTKMAHEWGIGQKGKDNGLLIYCSRDDRKIRIETGYGIEHKVTDGLSKRIIVNVIKPSFRGGNYFYGMDKSTDIIISLLEGEYVAELAKKKFPWAAVVVLVVFFIIVVLAAKSGNNGGGYSRRGHYGGLGGGYGGGFGGGGFGGGSSSGGFGGFGGGGFGGGGASGGW